MGAEEQHTGWQTHPCVPLQWLYCATARSQGAGELRSCVCQLCSAQLFALPGNFGSALFVLKLVIKCVQGVCMELGWSLPDPTRGSGHCSPRMTPGRELGAGARAEQINHRIMSASSWRLAMGSEPVPLTSGHSQCRSKEGGERKSHSACGKRGSSGLTSSFCCLRGKAHGSTDVVRAPVTVSFFLADPWCWELCEHT